MEAHVNLCAERVVRRRVLALALTVCSRCSKGVVAVFWIVTLILLGVLLGWAGWYDWRRRGALRTGLSGQSLRAEQGRADAQGGGGWAPRGGGTP